MARVWRERIKRVAFMLVVGLWLSLAHATLYAQDDSLSAPTNSYTTLYAGAGHTFASTGELPVGTQVVLLARNPNGDWLFVRSKTLTPLEGWMRTGFLDLPEGFSLSQVPVRPTDDVDMSRITDPLEAQLYAIPILPEITSATCQLYGAGVWGNRQLAVVSKIGDSNSASSVYLAPMGTGNYALGAYDELQASLDYYGASLANTSRAAQVGLNVAAVFDPFWANDSQCQAGESPLACELRLSAAGVAVIMFGINDTQALNRAQYEEHMRALITATLEARTLPIIIAFTSPLDYEKRNQVIHFNLISAQLAQDYGVPFINFWSAAQGLYNAGVGADGVHLAVSGGAFNLRGDESRYGMTLHNLLVLRVLDELRRTCIAETP